MINRQSELIYSLERQIAGLEARLDEYAAERAEVSPMAAVLTQTDTDYRNATQAEIDLLQRLVWAEARGEDLLGQVLVVNVVMNRLNSPNFPDTITDVIYQRRQFMPTWNGQLYRAAPTELNRQAVELALNGVDYSQGALFFNTYVPNGWHERSLELLFAHGAHRFYG